MSSKTNLAATLDLAQLSPASRNLLQDAPLATGPDRLFAARLDEDAVRLLAHALPPRQAVWWGCLCAWHGRGDPWPAEQEEALSAAVEWVVQPTGASAQAALRAFGQAGLTSAAGCLARAAAACGSLADARGDLELAARAVQGGVLYAYLERQRREPGFTYRQLAAIGLQVGRGEVLWEPRRSPGRSA